MSRSLSVHQGKGVTDADAMLGAILEGLEAHFAEAFDAPARRCSFSQLPTGVRPPSLAEFAMDSAVLPPLDSLIDWVVVRRFDQGEIAVPWACVSMDYTVALGTGLDRSSNGVAAGSNCDEAAFGALLELIERDAVVEWKALPMFDRIAHQLDWSTVEFDWFHRWMDRLRDCDVSARCYSVPGLAGIPVIACELADAGKSAAPFRAIHGHAAHPDPEIALFRALSEAIQGRAAFIAGSRDDLMPADYRQRIDAVRNAFAPPLPTDVTGTSMALIGHGPSDIEEIISRLHHHGLGPLAVIDLGRAGPFEVVRVMCCGLAARKRRRRRLP